jgi:bile acid:Na+ symporter, BASS family
MTLQELIGLSFKTSIFLIVFTLGIAAKPQDILFLFRKPSHLLRSLLSMNIIMPAVAVALAWAFDLSPAVKWALVTLAVSPVPPFLPVKQIKAGGCAPYAISLLAVEALLAIVFVPVSGAVCGRIFQNDAHVNILAIVLVVLMTILVPLAVGRLVGRFAPNVGLRIANPLARAGNVLLLIGLALVLFVNARGMVSLFGNGTLVTIVAFSVVGLAVGHLLGGPIPGERAVLALSTATRHPAVALAVVSANFPARSPAAAAIFLFVFVGMIVPIPYLRWIKPQITGYAAERHKAMLQEATR